MTKPNLAVSAAKNSKGWTVGLAAALVALLDVGCLYLLLLLVAD